MRSRLVPVLLAAFWATRVSAQAAELRPQVVTLKLEAGKLHVSGGLENGRLKAAQRDSMLISVKGDTDAINDSLPSLRLRVGTEVIDGKVTGSAKQFRIRIPSGTNASVVLLSVQPTPPHEIATIPIDSNATTPAIESCRRDPNLPNSIRGKNPGSLAMASFRRVEPAYWLVDEKGNVMVRTGNGLREDQTLRLTVEGPKSVLNDLVVKRTSDPRDATAIIIAGEQRGSGTVMTLDRDSTSAEAQCVVEEFELGDFAPGNAKVLMAKAGAPANQAVEVSVPVRGLSHGHVSIGVLRTSVPDPEFKLETRQVPRIGKTQAGVDTTFLDDKKFVIDASDSTRRLATMIFLTAFWPRPLDLDGPDAFRDLGWWVAPVIGFAPKTPTEQVFVGLTSHIGRVMMVHVGWHFAKGKRLQSDSVAIKPFTGDENDIPTKRTWHTSLKPQWAVSIDGSVIQRFLNATLGAALNGWFSPTTPAKEAAATTDKEN